MDRLDMVMKDLRGFVEEREWEVFHDPKNLAMAIASEAGELIAEYRWVPNADADRFTASNDHRRRTAAEAADIGTALLLFCDRIGLDFDRGEDGGQPWELSSQAVTRPCREAEH